DFIRWRQDAAGHAELDDIGAVLDVVANGPASFFRIVDDAVFRSAFASEQTGPESILEIAVPAGRPYRVHRYQHARTRNHARRGGVSQPHVHETVACEIARGGDARHQRFFQILRGEQRLLRDGFLHRIENALAVIGGVHKRQMRVRIDEPGRQRDIAELDGSGAPRNRRVRADAGDARPNDHHHARRAYLMAVEEPRRLEDEGLRLLAERRAADYSQDADRETST